MIRCLKRPHEAGGLSSWDITFLEEMAPGLYGNRLSLDSLALSLELSSFHSPTCWKFGGMYVEPRGSLLNVVALVYLGQC